MKHHRDEDMERGREGGGKRERVTRGSRDPRLVKWKHFIVTKLLQ
jgi:hypothetical protein